MVHDTGLRQATTAGVVVLDDDIARVRAAVAALTPLDREALVLRAHGHRDLDEIAERTRTTTAMVRVRIRRAAAAVEDAVGPLPPTATSGRTATVDATHAVEDAEMGITPVLSVRLARALDRTVTPEPGPVARRWRELLEALRR